MDKLTILDFFNFLEWWIIIASIAFLAVVFILVFIWNREPKKRGGDKNVRYRRSKYSSARTESR